MGSVEHERLMVQEIQTWDNEQFKWDNNLHKHELKNCFGDWTAHDALVSFVKLEKHDIRSR